MWLWLSTRPVLVKWIGMARIGELLWFLYHQMNKIRAQFRPRLSQQHYFTHVPHQVPGQCDLYDTSSTGGSGTVSKEEQQQQE